MLQQEDVPLPYHEEAVRLCDVLQSSDRFERKRALLDLVTFFREDGLSLPGLRFHSFFLTYAPIILNTLRDPTEIVREAGIHCVRTFILELLPADQAYTMCVMPVLAERIGTPEMVEPSEELRLQLMQLVLHILTNYQRHHMELSFPEFSSVLQNSVKDSCPVVKRISCEGITLLARAMPDHFRHHAGAFVKPILSTVKHRHMQVRQDGIKCLGEVLLHCDGDIIAEAIGSLTEKLLDSNPSVRRSVIQVCADLLRKYRDRYSCFHRLLPLMLTSLGDGVKEIQDDAANLWELVGIQYLQENEERLKEQHDYLTETLPNYPADVTRPHLGCRALVQANLSKYVIALANELKSWQIDVRIRCSQLLLSTVIHAEDDIIQQLPQLLTSMYSAVLENDSYVVENITRATEMMAYFVPVQTWLQLILPAMEENVTRGHLRILASFIRGTTREDVDSKTILRILGVLAEKDVAHVRKVKYQTDFMACLAALLTHYRTNMPPNVAQHLFNAFVTLLSIRDNETGDSNADLVDLQTALKAATLNDVWEQYLPALLEDVVDNNPRTWEQSTVEHSIFIYILHNSKSALGKNLPKIVSILREALHENAEAQTRLITYHALSNALTAIEVCFANEDPEPDYLSIIIRDIIAPALVWKAGRQHESVRTMAVLCLANAMTRTNDMYLISKDTLQSLFDRIFPLLITLSEDQEMRLRRTALDMIIVMKTHMKHAEIWTITHFINIYPKVLKRLDDAKNEIHCLAASVLLNILDSPPDEFKLELYQSHHELLLDTLFIHFDVSNDKCRDSIIGAIQVMAQLNGKLVLKKSEYYLQFVRNKTDCTDIINALSRQHIH